jgi:hypothetical protein
MDGKIDRIVHALSGFFCYEVCGFSSKHLLSALIRLCTSQLYEILILSVHINLSKSSELLLCRKFTLFVATDNLFLSIRRSPSEAFRDAYRCKKTNTIVH